MVCRSAWPNRISTADRIRKITEVHALFVLICTAFYALLSSSFHLVAFAAAVVVVALGVSFRIHTRNTLNTIRCNYLCYVRAHTQKKCDSCAFNNNPLQAITTNIYTKIESIITQTSTCWEKNWIQNATTNFFCCSEEKKMKRQRQQKKRRVQLKYDRTCAALYKLPFRMTENKMLRQMQPRGCDPLEQQRQQHGQQQHQQLNQLTISLVHIFTNTLKWFVVLFKHLEMNEWSVAVETFTYSNLFILIMFLFNVAIFIQKENCIFASGTIIFETAIQK